MARTTGDTMLRMLGLRMLGLRLVGLAMMAILAGCAGGDPDGAEPPPAHETPDDLLVTKARAPGVPSTYNREHIMDDAFFTGSDAVTVAQVQAFFENNPYNRRSFFADETINGQSAAAFIVAAAREKGINPIVILSRMQAEKSLIYKTERPSGNAWDYAFGCGCHDNRPCNPVFKGFDKQLQCAVDTLRRHYDGSVAGDGLWVRGVAKRTLDPISVTPRNHCTASFYAYTPWVQEGSSGSWLTWNITLKYAQHFDRMGADLPSGDGDNAGQGNANPIKWVGDACGADAECNFGGGESGVCRQGLCTLSCEGYCPDRRGKGVTFCVKGELLGEAAGVGLCVQQSTGDNQQCASLPGTEAQSASRFLGSSRASARDAMVCLPSEPGPPAGEPAPPAEPEPPVEPEPAGEPEAPVEPEPAGEPEPPRAIPIDEGCGDLTFAGECEGSTVWWCDAGVVQSHDCGTEGLTCGWIDRETGNWCE